jgi:hypothetical protein
LPPRRLRRVKTLRHPCDSPCLPPLTLFWICPISASLPVGSARRLSPSCVGPNQNAECERQADD